MTIRSDLATERPDVDEQHALPDLAGCEPGCSAERRISATAALSERRFFIVASAAIFSSHVLLADEEVRIGARLHAQQVVTPAGKMERNCGNTHRSRVAANDAVRREAAAAGEPGP